MCACANAVVAWSGRMTGIRTSASKTTPGVHGCDAAQTLNIRDDQQVLQCVAMPLRWFGKPAVRATVSAETDRRIERRADRSRLTDRLEQLEGPAANLQQSIPSRLQVVVAPRRI